MQAKDIMTASVISINPWISVREVAALLRERRISGVPVVPGDLRVLHRRRIFVPRHAAGQPAEQAAVPRTDAVVGQCVAGHAAGIDRLAALCVRSSPCRRGHAEREHTGKSHAKRHDT